MPEDVALVALGGYGRGVLAPGSDLDLLILHDGSSTSDVAALAEHLLYPLWDAGLRVGHAVRTPDACVEIAAERLDATTAMLDGRVLAGSGSSWDDVRSALLELVRGDPRAFAERLAADREARRDRFGSVSSLLEPELKEGVGGLRDVHALAWLQTAIGPPLEDAGFLRESERRSVEGAEEFLTRVRGALHLESGRGSDRLLAELQPQVAPAMGFADEPGLPAVDGLMRSVFEQARQVEHVSASVFDRFLRGSSLSAPLDPTPEGILRAFAAVARDGDVMPAASLDALAAVTIDADLPWTEPIRAAFLELLAVRPGGGRRARDPRPRRPPRTLRAGVGAGPVPAAARPVPSVLGRRAPARLVRRRRSAAGRSGRRPFGGARGARRSATPTPCAWARSCTTSARPARATTSRSGRAWPGRRSSTWACRARRPDLARFLVAEHLLLSDTATRRDLDDERLIVGVADRVGDPGRLAALYLLTMADAEATGPLAWTPWRATLVRELVAKVRHVLERDDVGSGTAERLTARAEEIRAALAGEDPEAVERFLLRMPRGYVLTVPIDRVPIHHRLLVPAVGSHEVRTHATEGSRAAAYDLAVVAADRPGLLSMIAGALSLAGLSILTAQVFTTDDGVAVDLFEIEGAFEPEVGEERWREFRTTLRKAIEGRLSLDHRVREKRRHYPGPQADVPVRVEVDNDVSDFFTVIEVGAPDRLGLLFDITRTFAELQLDVHLAKVATFGGRVVDAFYVRDDLGRRVDDLERIRELEDALRGRIAP